MARLTNAQLLGELESARIEIQRLRTVNQMLIENQARNKPAAPKAIPSIADAAQRYCAEKGVKTVTKPVLMAWIGGAK
jgi:hypothetical protein